MGALFGLLAFQASGAEDAASIHVDAFNLPRYSDYLSTETRSGIERGRALGAQARQLCDSSTKSTGKEIRACEALMYPPILAEARRLYDVRIIPETIGGVQTDVVTPAEGVGPKRTHRVLINVHGGGFKNGARFGGQLEAMPVAAIGKYKVVAVDYRMGPEHHFPAASVDVAAVYSELLKEYDASSIGLYGCSAGGRIVGQAIAWMAEHELPRPGAIAILCSPPTRFGGDSNIIAAALQGREPLARGFNEGYFKGVQPADPLAFPGDSHEMLAKFPPALLMTSTRDYSLSPMVQMHSRMVRLGMPADLHIFEGFAHAEFLSMYVPEAREAARIISTFFDAHLGGAKHAEKQAELDADGVYHFPGFAVPPSELASEEYKQTLIKRGRAEADRATGKAAGSFDLSSSEAILNLRRSTDTARRQIAEDMQRVFPVSVTPEVIGGVQTDVVIPKSGVASKNKNRVLINLHGGGFVFGARYEGQIASIPIASLGQIKVITVDYRMAPEHRFPAASEDVARVYGALLKRYKSENIGIYGHSAGAMLTAQSLAWFQQHSLPRPGAIGLDGGGAAGAVEGDSAYLAGAFLFGIPSYPPGESDTIPKLLGLYFKDADMTSGLVAPVHHPDVLRGFPPTLITNSTRDPTMSSAIHTHRQLLRQGVAAELHLWEGLPHSFHYDPSLPESRESYEVLVRFFDRYLGV